MQSQHNFSQKTYWWRRKSKNGLLTLGLQSKTDEPLSKLPELPEGWTWFLSTPNVPGVATGTPMSREESYLPKADRYKLQYRFIGLQNGSISQKITGAQILSKDFSPAEDFQNPMDLHQLGILEDDHLDDESRYPISRGRGPLQEAMAVCEMVALQQEVPFRRDTIKKVIESQFRRDKGLSIELMAGLTELLGMTSQLAAIDTNYINSIEAPAILFLEDVPVILQGVKNNSLLIAHPHHGLQRLSISKAQELIGEKIRYVLPRRTASTPTSRFGWGWFTPLLKKYRKPLILVFISSLLAQVFGLAIPLLLQQIIDKVLTQGNLSSLNVLGSAMVIMALFQGILQALRTFIFVDTTDRMDLTLGSAVIDRLLALPLSYFEKRPIGELSQRLGELNTIRGFLTGTALISILNLVFASVYLVVMFVYSPL